MKTHAQSLVEWRQSLALWKERLVLWIENPVDEIQGQIIAEGIRTCEKAIRLAERRAELDRQDS